MNKPLTLIELENFLLFGDLKGLNNRVPDGLSFLDTLIWGITSLDGRPGSLDMAAKESFGLFRRPNLLGCIENDREFINRIVLTARSHYKNGFETGDLVKSEEQNLVCQCGSDKIGSNHHSSWCDKNSEGLVSA